MIYFIVVFVLKLVDVYDCGLVHLSHNKSKYCYRSYYIDSRFWFVSFPLLQ